MSDYQAVSKALESGASPAMLCQTCPWDRTCLTPPSMTSAEINAKMQEAAQDEDKKAQEAAAAGKSPGMPIGSLMTAVIFAGKDTSAQVCPVFALRLRSSGGRQIADGLKASMQAWDDES